MDSLHYAFSNGADDVGAWLEGAGKKEGPHLDVIETFKDEEETGSVRIQLASSTINLPETLRKVVKFNMNRWPLLNKHGMATISYVDPNDNICKGAVMDVGTFINLFDQPTAFGQGMLDLAHQLTHEWNEKYGGRKEIGKREPVEKWIPLRTHRLPTGTGGKVATSTVAFNMNSWNAVADGLNRSQVAKLITEQHIRVQLRLRSNLKQKDGDADFGSSGFACSLGGFYKLLHSEEARRAVEEAKKFIRCCPPISAGDLVEPRFPAGGIDCFKEEKRGRKKIDVKTATEPRARKKRPSAAAAAAAAPPPKKKPPVQLKLTKSGALKRHDAAEAEPVLPEEAEYAGGALDPVSDEEDDVDSVAELEHDGEV